MIPGTGAARASVWQRSYQRSARPRLVGSRANSHCPSSNCIQTLPPHSLTLHEIWALFALCTRRAIRAPPIERSHALRRQRMAGFMPAARPFHGIAQLCFWVVAAAGDEAREGAAAGGLADRVVAQVEAPADVVAMVGVGGVDGQS